jgi:hypothetical protein
MPEPGPADKRLRDPGGLLDGPMVFEPPVPDGIPDPDPGRLERQPEGWVPFAWEGMGAAVFAFQELVRHITYKPGYRLEVRQPWDQYTRGGGVLLSITARLEDTYHPGQFTEQAMNFTVVPYVLERWGEWLERRPELARQDMLRLVLKCLGIHELHERDEWFRVDGVMVFDPHRGDATRLDFTRTR